MTAVLGKNVDRGRSDLNLREKRRCTLLVFTFKDNENKLESRIVGIFYSQECNVRSERIWMGGTDVNGILGGDEAVDVFKLLIRWGGSLQKPGHFKIRIHESGLKLLIHCCRLEIPFRQEVRWVRKD